MHIGPGLPSCRLPVYSYLAGPEYLIFFFLSCFSVRQKGFLEAQLLVLTYKVYKVMMNILGVLSTSYVVFLPPFSHILLRAVFCGSPAHTLTSFWSLKQQRQHLERGCHCGAMSFLVNMMYVVNKQKKLCIKACVSEALHY